VEFAADRISAGSPTPSFLQDVKQELLVQSDVEGSGEAKNDDDTDSPSPETMSQWEAWEEKKGCNVSPTASASVFSLLDNNASSCVDCGGTDGLQLDDGTTAKRCIFCETLRQCLPYDETDVDDDLVPHEQKDPEDEPNKKKDPEDEPNNNRDIEKNGDDEHAPKRARPRWAKIVPAEKEKEKDKEKENEKEKTAYCTKQSADEKEKEGKQSADVKEKDKEKERTADNLENILQRNDSAEKLPRQTVCTVATPSSGASTLQMSPLCVKCAWPTDPFNAVMRSKATASSHAKWICRPCNSVSTMIARSVCQQGNMNMKAWTEEQAMSFFSEARENGFVDGRANWGLIRGCLKKLLTKRKKEITTKAVDSAFLPLDVWANQGYDVQMISAYNKSEWNPACGMCYACPIKSLKWEHVEMQIEEEIMQAEKAYKEKNKAPAAADDSSDESAVEEKKKSKGSRRSSAKLRKEEQAAKDAKEAEKEAEKAAKKEQAEIKNSNNKTQILASKAISVLSVPVETMKKVVKGANWSKIPVILQDKFKADLEQGEKYISESDAVIKQVKKCSKSQTKLPTICFDHTGLGILAKNLRKNSSDYGALEKLLKDRSSS